MKKFIFLICTWMIFTIASPEITMGGNNNLKMIILKNNMESISSILNANVYNLIDPSNLNIIHTQDQYLKYFQLNEKEDYEYFSNLIPEEYLFSFFYFTKDKKEIRNLIYVIMKHESINFQAFTNQNKNGSIDYGPMMLNSDNLKNEKFMKLFSPNLNKINKLGINIENNKIDRYNYYISICINYISYLIERYEKENREVPIWFALRAYNAGENANTIYASKSSQRKGTIYANKVYKMYKNLTMERNHL